MYPRNIAPPEAQPAQPCSIPQSQLQKFFLCPAAPFPINSTISGAKMRNANQAMRKIGHSFSLYGRFGQLLKRL